ncbi:MAG: metal-sensitive transcriptional regulator [Patescibacteria group bacterium]
MKQSPVKSRLHRLVGQIQGVEKMMESNRDCQEIIQQLMAARASLEKICLAILHDETSSCFIGQKNSKEKLKDLEYITHNLFKIK